MKIATLATALLAAMAASAADIMKANNSDDLNLPSSWEGGVLPGPDDYMFWHPFTTTEKVKLGGDMAVCGVVVTNNKDKASLDFGVANESAVLTLGEGGYYVRNSGKTVTVYSKTKLACDQTWVNNAGTFVVAGDVDLNGKTLTVEGGIEVKGSANAHDGTIVQKTGNYKMSSGTYSENVDFVICRNSILQFNQEPAKNGHARARNVTLDGSEHYDSAQLYSNGRKENDGYDVVSGTVLVTNGLGRIRVSPNNTRHQTVEIGTLDNSHVATLWICGTNLGQSPIDELTPNHASIKIKNAPTLVGSGESGTPAVGIIPWAICATNDDYGFSFATYDSTCGVRPLDLETEYATALTSGETHGNVRLVSSGSGAQAETTLASGTTTIVNSLVLDTAGYANTQGGVIVQGGEGAVLQVASGMVYGRQMMADVSSVDALTISGVTLDFAGHGGQIVSRQTKQSNMTSNAPLQLDCVIANDGGEGVTFSSVANRGLIYLQGTSESTYAGPTRLINGNLRMVKGKDADNHVVPAVPGDLYIYGGSCQNTGSQIKETANVFVYGGSYLQKGGASNSGSGASQTFRNLFVAGNGSVTSGASGTSAGSTTMNDGAMLGGTWTVCRGHAISMQRLTMAGGTMNVNKFEASNRKTQLKVANGIVISNLVSGAYRPITFEKAENAQKVGGSLFIAGGITLVGNDTNTNRVEIYNEPSMTEGATKAHFYMASTQTFDISDGAADVDLYFNLDGADETEGAGSGLIKTGAGTLLLGGDNTYTGGTTVEAGRLIADGALASAVTVAAGATFRGGDAEESGSLAVTGDVTLASGAKLEADPGATMAVSGTLALNGAEVTVKPGATVESEFLVARATKITGAPTSNLGKFRAKVRNGGTELWISRDNGFVVILR